MRVLHILDHSLPLQSGYVTRSLGIIRAQRGRGWETLHLTTPRHIGAPVTAEVIDGLTFFRTPPPRRRLPLAREVSEMRNTRAAIEKLIVAEKPDVLHAHSPVLNVLPALAAGRKFDLPVVYEVRALWEDAAVDHGTTTENALRYTATRALETYAMRRSDHVVTLCEPLRVEILARGIGVERVTVVPNAVDPKRFVGDEQDQSVRERLGLSGAKVVGFIGSFYAYEGLDLLFQALPALIRDVPDLSVLLVGGGPDEERLRSLANNPDIKTRVHFAGRVHEREVPRYYAAMDLLVYPRRRRRLTELVTPLKPLEAMAHRKPLVASDVGGHKELVRDEETGFLFQADDATALAARVAQVLSDPSELLRVASQGRRFVERERNWGAVVERYAGIYAKLIGARGRKARGLMALTEP